MDIKVIPGAQVNGTVACPGDKSITQRAILLASLAHGHSSLTPFSTAQDNLSTLHACRQLGVNANFHGNKLMIHGQGGQLTPSEQVLALGNSGTGMRLLSGVLAGQAFTSQLDGDASLRQRPMQRIIAPLSLMGATVKAREGCCPLQITGQRTLKALTHQVDIASAQVKSCIIFAALAAAGETVIQQSTPTRDHTERLLMQMGYPLHVSADGIHISGQAPLQGCDFTIPGDFSSAAFFILAATLAKNSSLVLQNIGINPRRIAFLTLLKQMGANIECRNQREFGHEPVADIHVSSTSLNGIDVDMAMVSDMLDEFPCLAIAAACSHGETLIRGAQELRVKESDRLQAMTQGLRQLGIKVQEYQDGVCITGGVLQGGEVTSFQDHRIAMAFMIAGNCAKQPIYVRDCGMVATSFPNFIMCAQSLGLQLVNCHEEKI